MSGIVTSTRADIQRAGKLQLILVGVGIPFLYQTLFTLTAFVFPPTVLPPLAWVCLHLLTGVLFTCCPVLAVRMSGLSLRNAWRAIGGKPLPLLDGTLAVLIGVLVTVPPQMLFYAGLHFLFGISNDFGFSQSSQALLPFLLFVVVVGPLGEETFFRGFLGSLRLRPWQFIALSSVVWSAIHVDPVAFLPLLWTGIVFAAMRLKTGSFYASYLTHVTINALAIVMYFWLK
jgi:membrane protease YdiL (CAAX protease family)